MGAWFSRKQQCADFFSVVEKCLVRGWLVPNRNKCKRHFFFGGPADVYGKNTYLMLSVGSLLSYFYRLDIYSSLESPQH